MNIKAEKARELREKAMPEVQKIVQKYGRSTIYGCIMRMADYDKKLHKIEEAKKELAALEKQLKV
jgi:coenzyme F420-reducing hydrogenase gamma subunit